MEMDDYRLQKRALRKEVRAQIASLSEGQRQREANAVFAGLRALHAFHEARTVLLFWSMDDELPTRQAVEALRAERRVALPVVRGDELELYEYTGADCLRAVPPYGIEEPTGTPSVADGDIDLIVVPGVAFDRHLGRMGRGKGFYDRLFARIPRALRIGVCFACQVVPTVPMEPHDWRMDGLITAEGDPALVSGVLSQRLCAN